MCFLDPSDRGDTLYKVLSYCAKIGHDKVILIDPHHCYSFGKIAPINPFNRFKEASIASMADTLRVVFNTKDQAETARINRFLPAILSVLWNAGMTVHETLYFTELIYKVQRMIIMSKSDEFDRHRLLLEEVFNSRAMFLNEIQSTVRRLEPLFHPTLDLMLSTTEGLDFAKLIADRWVIFVNLYSGFGFEPIHTRLLGTLIINEIISSVDRLRHNGWKGVYYLYVDEAGRYANRNLADLLAYKRKSGLRVTLAHQYFGQFEDPFILDAVQNLCKIKIAFNIPSREDRDKVVRAMYGGELGDREVSYSLSTLRKQHAVVKKPKEAPIIVRIPDIPDIQVDLKPYLEKIYSNPVYKTPNEIKQETKLRLYETPRASDPPPKKRATANKKSVSKTAPSQRPDTGWQGLIDSLREDKGAGPKDDPK